MNLLTSVIVKFQNPIELITFKLREFYLDDCEKEDIILHFL